MINLKLRYVICFLLLLIPFRVLATDCDFNDINKYQSLASNINFNYDFEESNNDVTFNIIITNMPEELYIKSEDGKTFSYRTLGSSETTLYGYKSGEYSFKIYTYDEKCNGEVFGTNYITLPYYNKYYKDKVCDDAKDYKLCQKWVNPGMSYKDFVDDVKKHKNDSATTTNSKLEEEAFQDDYSNDFLNKIIVGFLNNYIVILLSIIIICSILMVILSRRGRFDLK